MINSGRSTAAVLTLIFSAPAQRREVASSTDRMPPPRQDVDKSHGLKLNVPPAFVSEFGHVLEAYLKTQHALRNAAFAR